ncbi:MAG TPA: hypothetical protein VE569_08930 [Acidimicrobiia bacterium]|nr:hypothetical protein [Acidimicrobiia bacterium]
MGKPFVEGDRAVVEFWTTMRLEGKPLTLCGALLLNFDNAGLCMSLREYYSFADGYLDPPVEWGS